MFDSTLLAGHSGYIPTHHDFNNALLRPTGTCYNMQGGQSRGWVWQDFITPQGVLGCRAAKGSPSPGHSPSPEVTQEEHPGPDGAGYLIHSYVIACGEGQLDNWTSFCIIFVLLYTQFSIKWYTARNFLFWFPRLLLWFPAASFGPNWWAICSVHEHHAGPVGEQVDGREDNAGRVPSQWRP